MNPPKVVAIGAHPDDIELSMSGMLLRFQKTGSEITWIVATDGAAGNGGRDPELARTRASEAQAAAKSAGAQLIQCGFPDGQLSWQHDAPAVIGRHIGLLKPDLIVTHAMNDYHPDHRAVARIVGDIAPVGTPILRADNMLGLYFSPELLVDISEVFEAKLAALALHESQKALEFRETLTTWNRFRGLQSVGRKFWYAEAFTVDHRLSAELRPFLDRIGGYVML